MKKKQKINKTKKKIIENPNQNQEMIRNSINNIKEINKTKKKSCKKKT